MYKNDFSMSGTLFLSFLHRMGVIPLEPMTTWCEGMALESSVSERIPGLKGDTQQAWLILSRQMLPLIKFEEESKHVI